MPPAHLVSVNHRLLTSLNVAQLQQLYKPSAFEVDAPVYIYAGKQSHDHHQDGRGQASSGASTALRDEKLVKIVLSLMEENVWRQKFLAGLDVKEKRRQMMEDNFAKRAAQSRVGLSDEDGLSGSSQDGLSHMMKREASPNPIIDHFDLDHRVLLEQHGGGANVPNWRPPNYQTV